ncbi:protein NO VEIN isoform X1 [Typha latifolia]|uniref:protein NO VEIN isoform X1 n=2 Tax=Typha latifolia TaxID=4733 RepID=UPI003C2FE0AB
MYRPQRGGRGGSRGGGGSIAGGGSFLSSQCPPQNPNFPYAANLQYFANPFNLAQFQFQNSTFPLPPNPGYIQNPTFPYPSATTPSPQALLERAEAAAVKAHEDLVMAGESVSAWKVSQAVLVSLQVDSWSSLGFQLQDVRSLRELLVTEGKVSAFIHCFVAARKITSLYDLEVEICKNEGVEQFEELRVGPLSRHPLAVHYFSVPSDSTEVFKISSEEIIGFLQTFVNMSRKMIKVEDFLDFLAEKKSVPAKEKLGVRIQSLGLHISYIRQARREEATILRESVKHNADSSRERYISQSEIRLEKKILDKKFTSISRRINTFSSSWDDFSGKHIRFDSTDDEADVDDDGDNKGDNTGSCQNQSSFHNKDCDKRISSCPYPSTTEEMVRLGLKSETLQKEALGNGKLMDSGAKRSSGKKRKLQEEKNNSCVRNKMPKDKQIFGYKIQRNLRELTLSRGEMEQFIATWKEACREHSVAEVLELMVNFYAETVKQQRRIRKSFLSYPGIGLLNVAVRSMEHGMLDSLYDAFETCGENGSSNPCSATFAKMIENGSLNKEIIVSNSKEASSGLGYSVTVDDIIKRVADYFEFNNTMPREGDPLLKKRLLSLKKFHDCEMWVTNRFSIEQFSSLGYGSFLGFLDKYASLFPHELSSFIMGTFHCPSYLEVVMVQKQLGVLLCQAGTNWLSDGAKSDVFMLLKRQFPTVSFNMVGEEPEKHFLDRIKGQRESDNPKSIVFSIALLGKQWAGNSSEYGDISSLGDSGMISEATQQSHSREAVSSQEAIGCLLKAPLLSDLLLWSHWDHVYAPSLGSFVNWLLNVKIEELACIVTRDGKFIKIEASVTVDQFLEAFIQRSSFQVAVKLLSLLYMYHGAKSAPISLLKCYAHRAIDVIIRNSMDSGELDNQERSFSPLSCDSRGISDSNPQASNMHKELSRINNAVSFVARFIVECLGYLPSEVWSFAAEILLSGLKPFTKNAYLAVLHECSETSQRCMLHDIGLTSGITDWVNDYHKFKSTAATDLKVASVPRVDLIHISDLSERPTSDNSNFPVGVMTSTCETDNNEPFSEVNIMDLDATLALGQHNASTVSENEVITGLPVNKSGILEEGNLQEATDVVESIRREEFGLDPNLSYTESCLLMKQHARLGRALHCLSQELYSQDSHLLLELVQNADDNIYPENVEPTLVFILEEAGIVVLNNELGFSAQNIRALCDIGNSTKKGSNAGYIGHKGIGFKSVFRVTDAPEIHSNGFHVKFDITEGQIGFVLPTVVLPCDVSMYSRLLSVEDYQINSSSWRTCILLPFRSKFQEGTGLSSIISMFSDLHPSLLLFLHRLECIKFKNMLNDTFLVMRRKSLSDGIVKISKGNEIMSWLVVSKKLQGSTIRHDVHTTEISMAFTLQDSDNGQYQPTLSLQPVFAFLPLRNYGLKFILQGDFVLPSSREEVDGDSAWNQWLLSEFPALFVSAEESFCALPCFQSNPGKAITAFMSFVPLVGEVHGFFSHLPHMIISKLRMKSCLILDGPDLKWVHPCRVLRGWNEQARLLLSDSLLQKYLGLGYLNKDVILSDTLTKALGIQDYGPKILTELISSICRSNSIQSLGLDWLSAWLATLYSTLSAQSTGNFSLNTNLESDIICCLREIPFIPLSDGSYSSVSDGPIWLPCDVLSAGREGKHNVKEFPNLYSKLRIVAPLLLTATGSAYIIEEMRVTNVVDMLHKIGVQKLSAHEIIKGHILEALANSVHTQIDKGLMVEYLSFIMLHFQCSCASCHAEKAEIIAELRKKPVLLTNHGYKCPSEVHFSKEYGNPLDVEKLISVADVKWIEVDAAYLKHPSAQSLQFGLTWWREFLLELGVTDFVQVICLQKSAPEIPSVVSGSSCIRDLCVTPSFIDDWESPELVNLLAIVSSQNQRKNCIYLLEVLDKFWDDCYSAKARSHITLGPNEDEKTIESSFIKSIRKFKWIASSMDEDLHYSKDLYYDCESVRSLLGTMAPYAVPQVTSKLLLKEIGFKTEVSLDDAMIVLNSWRVSKTPFNASAAQMSKFYTFISDGVASSKVNINLELISSSFIFTPFWGARSTEVISGVLLSPKDVYWHDPTGCFDMTKEFISTKKNYSLLSKMLSAVYPSLHDFFVKACGVPDVPSLYGYFEILLQLSSVVSPLQAAKLVFRVLKRWADEFNYGVPKSEDLSYLKDNLHKLENTVLPTLKDKWASLHPSFGLICWADDEELKQHFKNSDTVDFLYFGELSIEDKATLSGKVAKLLQSLGVPALSKVVSREAIFYGTEDNGAKSSLINWLLPYAQRYINKMYPDIYENMKCLGFEKLTQLQIVVVEKLYYKYTLKGCESTSKKRFQCSSVLQGNTLYATQNSDPHSIFMEFSRFFFNGSTELHFANFLHMVTTMAESGSTSEQTEFFIVNSQNVPKLPDDEPIWSISTLLGSHEDGNPQPIHAPSMHIDPNILSQRKPSTISNWPPTDWKTAPDFNSSRANLFRSKPGSTPYGGCLLTEFSMPLETSCQVNDIPVPVQVEGDWIIEEGVASRCTSTLQGSVVMIDRPNLVESVDSADDQINLNSERRSILSDPVVINGGSNKDLASLPEFTGIDRLWLQTPDENQTRKTGRLGEIVAYKFFAEKLGSGNVKWVNEETETGLPYDLIIGDKEGNREYVEVKATISLNKDWFPISMREWQFAVEKCNSFSIAHVVLLGPRKASITVLQNPYKLCQQNSLRLAIVMSRQLRDSVVTT